jgi:8-oxo-dGTP diphosphatase/2-hydroxy-dATP diphosphatase
MSEVTKTTIVFPVQDDRVLLGMKKRGFGEGWWNGFGGKLEGPQTWEDNARDETFEECGLIIGQLRMVARILFHFDDELKVISQVFTTSDFTGSPKETDEMRPQWFPTNALPYEQMWPADRHWIPQALTAREGDEFLGFAVYFDSDKNFLRIGDVGQETLNAHFQN